MKAKFINENFQINEGAGSLAGLPSHWVKYLVGDKYSGAYGNKAGEYSQIETLSKPYTDKLMFSILNKDADVIAIIIRANDKPLFMIAKFESGIKFSIFGIEKGGGRYDSIGYRYRKGRTLTSEDTYTSNQIIQKIDEYVKQHPTDIITVSSIKKDIERAEKQKIRREIKNITDPLEVTKNWSAPDTQLQRDVLKRYANLKYPRFEAQAEMELDNLKELIINNLDTALSKYGEDVKKGYTFNVKPEDLGKQLVKGVDMKKILELTNVFSKIKDITYIRDKDKKGVFGSQVIKDR